MEKSEQDQRHDARQDSGLYPDIETLGADSNSDTEEF